MGSGNLRKQDALKKCNMKTGNPRKQDALKKMQHENNTWRNCVKATLTPSSFQKLRKTNFMQNKQQKTLFIYLFIYLFPQEQKKQTL